MKTFGHKNVILNCDKMVPNKVHLPELNLDWPGDVLGPRQSSGSDVVLGQGLPLSLVACHGKKPRLAPWRMRGCVASKVLVVGACVHPNPENSWHRDKLSS